MRYVPRRPHVSRNAPASTFVIETGVEVAQQWTVLAKEPHDPSLKRERVSREIVSRNMSAQSVKERMIVAMCLPCWEENQDVWDRFLYCIIDDDVFFFAQKLLKKGYEPKSHREALSYVEKLDYVLSHVAYVDNITLHIPAVSFLLLSPVSDIENSRSQIPFVPTIDELSTRVESDIRSSSFSLYPRVSKENVATRESIARKKRSLMRGRSKPGKVSVPKQKDVYGDSGSLVSRMKEEYVDMDEEAVELIMQGVSMDVVLQFHAQAPDGYWKKVSETLNNDENLTLDDIYSQLEVTFNYHPDSRDLPA